MDIDNVVRIGNYIGVHIKNDAYTQPIYPRKFIRIQVNVNITQSLNTRCFITRENGNKLWIHSNMRDSRTSTTNVVE